ncbi:hypothetical protein AAG570_008740 [Ranatra chinensis]|uniref:Major facilitator superfamily (MFS) profile domain-containing protein n=1 Tax=Ranatra chinensis TaxID=642074 RepID=A0ABD0YRR2_9HEMI
MASKRRNMFYKNKKQEATEIEVLIVANYFQWDLVCERNHLVSLVQTSFMLAAMVGSIGVSTLADRYGRKVVLAGGGLVMGIAGCCAGLVGSYWTFITLRFIQGMAVGATIALTQVYCVEILGPKGRSKFSLMVNLFAYLILIAFSGLAYITSHWRLYQIITTAPAILSVTFFWILPESPRWLIAVDRLDDALAVLQTAARWNDNPIPKYLPPKPKSEISEKTTEYSPLDLIRTSSMRRLTFITGFNFFSNGYCHYGIQQYLSHIRGNVFVNATLAGGVGRSTKVIIGEGFVTIVYRLLLEVADIVSGKDQNVVKLNELKRLTCECERYMNTFGLVDTDSPSFVPRKEDIKMVLNGFKYGRRVAISVFGLSGAVLALLLTNKFGRRVSLCTGQFIVTAAYFTFIFLPGLADLPSQKRYLRGFSRAIKLREQVKLRPGKMCIHDERPAHMNKLGAHNKSVYPAFMGGWNNDKKKKVDWMVWVKVCVGASGVVGTSTCFSTTYLYSSELFPTVIRNTAMGTINTCARNSTFPQVPPVLFGCLSLIAGLSVLGLPETRGVPLPETFDDVKIMRR